MKILVIVFVYILTSAFVFLGRCDDFDDYVGGVVRDQNVRGAAIAFFDAAKMASPITRGYGQVSSGSDSPAVTADTVFMLASVSKVFTGSAVSVLLNKKIIASLDDDICDVIPSSWQRSACRNPKFPNTTVTWRMLVTHRSSLTEDVPSVLDESDNEVFPGYGPSGGYDPEVPAAGNPTCPLEDVVGFYRDLLTDKKTETSIGADFITEDGKPINWYEAGEEDGGVWRKYEPGSKSLYSNLAVGYLAALVELATGQSFPIFCRENLFEPSKMVETAWFRRDLPTGTLEAVPVSYSDRGFSDVGHYCFIDYASGQLLSSAVDMALWCQSMLSYGAPTLWNESIGRQAFACQEREIDGTTKPPECEFGVNWILLDNSKKDDVEEDWLLAYKDYDWTDGVMHDGLEAGSQTQILVLPAAKVYAVVLTNTDGNDDMAAAEIAAALVHAPLPREGVAKGSITEPPTSAGSSTQPVDKGQNSNGTVPSTSDAWRILSLILPICTAMILSVLPIFA